jgi:phosphate transport system substrate-binding protein
MIFPHPLIWRAIFEGGKTMLSRLVDNRYPIGSSGYWGVLLSFVLVSLFALVACNTSRSSSTAGTSSNQIIGAGSTFIYPVMTQWIIAFQATHPSVQINYQSVGSGGGIQQLKKGLVDFGASDAALDDQQLKEMPPLVQIPESAGPVCITYNLPQLKSPLKLRANTLAGIYLGTTNNWRDAAIRKDNPGVTLPNEAIVVAHRSDGSGTTNIFTNYLAKVSPEWEKKVGKGIAVKWPAGIGGKGSEGVTAAVKETPGGIGYVELTYAKENNLPVAAIRNQAGHWIEPSEATTTATINAFEDHLAKDVREPIIDPPASAKDAYPIAGLTFLLVPKQGKDPNTTNTLRQFIEYIVTQGQDTAAALFYAKLPASLQQQDQALLSQLGTEGQHVHAQLKPATGVTR